MRYMVIVTFLGALAAGSLPVHAAPKAAYCQKVKPGSISVDGLRHDWQGLDIQKLAGPKYVVGGDARRWSGNSDLSADLRCAHDDKGMYLLLEVKDDRIVRTGAAGVREDRVELVVPGARGRVARLRIHPPSKSIRRAKVAWIGRRGGLQGISKSVIRLPKGYAIEIGFQPGSLPGFAVGTTHVPVSIRIHDHDRAGRVDAIVGTGGDRAKSLGRIEFDTAKLLFAAFLKQKGLDRSRVLHYRVGNYITGKAQEQLVFAGTWVALIGEDVMKGGAYYAMPVPFAKTQADVLRMRSVDLDNNGNLDIICVVRQQAPNGLVREVMVVLRFLDDGKMELYFAQEVKKTHQGKVLVNSYRFVKRGRNTDIEVKVGQNKGWTKRNHPNTASRRVEGILTPWGKQKKRVFQFQSDGYVEK